MNSEDHPLAAIAPQAPTLQRQVGVLGATMMGLGSILGTGIFVSIGVAAEAAGPAVLLAIAVAAVVACCNGLSSAQLAAAHPLSGGTYEYGYRWLNPTLGFTAGWTFLWAKSASAATAALGLAGYGLHACGISQPQWRVPLAVTAVVGMTVLVLAGIRRSTQANMAIVSVTLLSLTVFILAGLPRAFSEGWSPWQPMPWSSTSAWPPAGLLEACALMFVAYTGYGRIATLGEEIYEPRRNIPRAIIVTLLVSMAFYLAVGFVAVGAGGVETLAAATMQQAAPLEVIAARFRLPAVAPLIACGAVTAMLGVLLNLILGLSRVVFAMARRGDFPHGLCRMHAANSTPYAAVILVGLIIAGLALLGNVKTTWSFSAFSVLIYYAITNLAAVRLSASERLYPRFVPWCGLVSCLFLAFWVEPRIWMMGLCLIGLGWIWHRVALGRRGK